MSEGDVPAVVAATRVSQIEGVVTGVAVGAPIQRQPSGNASNATDAGLSSLASGMSVASPVVAEAVLYSPLLGKMFARYDLDKSGTIDKAELSKMIKDLGVDIDTDAMMATFGERSHREGTITLSEWEKGLDEKMRTAIEEKLDEEIAARVVKQ